MKLRAGEMTWELFRSERFKLFKAFFVMTMLVRFWHGNCIA